MKNEMDTDILAEEIRILREDRIIFGILKIESQLKYIENKNSLAGKEEIR